MQAPPTKTITLDVLVIGGGVAGLWTLDRLVAAGHQAALLERDALGQGQSICAQGILHGGVKYSLSGLLAPGARQVAAMPNQWAEHLAGNAGPDLSQVRVRSASCHLWRTDSMKSILGMTGAKLALQAKPSRLERSERPKILAACPGDVALLPERVLEMPSLLEVLAARHRGRILKGALSGGDIMSNENHAWLTVDLSEDRQIMLHVNHVVLGSGAGNESLLDLLLDGKAPESPPVTPAMQRRPLHMGMVKGADEDLPELNGHCVDGAKTRVTITSSTASDGQRVWQLGGELSETGCERSEAEQREAARDCLRTAIPGFDVDAPGLAWSTYRVDRAEHRRPQSRSLERPDDVSVVNAGRSIVVWPTKMVLAPRAADKVVSMIGKGSGTKAAPFEGLPEPEIAAPPWETTTWH
jgi:glycine/D-amino acid oxidase-like deaminating enzyme